MVQKKEIIQLRLQQLQPHPANRRIYGDHEEISALMESIREQGIREPLAVTADGQIISGHRRWRAARRLGMTSVPAVLVDGFRNEEDRLEALLTFNQQRNKTNEQRVREAVQWVRIEARRAAERQRAGVRPDPGKNFSGGAGPGRTRDKVAQRAGIGSGVSYEKGRQAVDLLDELAAGGRSDEAEGLRRLLNQSYDAGFQAVRRYRRERQATLGLLRLIGRGEAEDLQDAQQVAARHWRSRIPKDLPAKTDRYEIYQGDLLEVGESISHRLLAQRRLTIVCDPPYTAAPYGNGDGDRFRDAYRKLGEFAARFLPKGCSLLAQGGTYHLPEILAVLSAQPELSYYWTIAVVQQGRSPKQRWRLVTAQWKPVLWYVKGEPADHRGDKITDLVFSQPNRHREHAWQQPPALLEHLIANLTRPGELVVDPFMGIATTGIVALRMGRRFLGIEVDPAVYRQAAWRLKQAARRPY